VPVLLKKTLDNQQAAAASILQAIPALPANPAIGRNIPVAAEPVPQAAGRDRIKEDKRSAKTETPRLPLSRKIFDKSESRK
jgi:type IV secretory pathway VirB10-like protein